MQKPKTINALMAYLRNTKQIEIRGSINKRKLRFMGYFHGYKGYRFCSTATNPLPYTCFNELQSVYDFDMALKTLLYGRIMFLETVIKNYALECITEEAGSSNFADVFSTSMTAYKSIPAGSKRREAMQMRLAVRGRIYSIISDNHKSPLVSHYYDNEKPVPIWSIFEMLSLGEFGNLLLSLNKDLRLKISKSIGIKSSVDVEGKMMGTIVFTIKDLRNAVAHNRTVFDARFKTAEPPKRLSGYIEHELCVRNITFSTIIDYVLLIAFLMKALKCNKSDIVAFINQFESVCEELRRQVPYSIYSKIVYSDFRNKIAAVKKYCKG